MKFAGKKCQTKQEMMQAGSDIIKYIKLNTEAEAKSMTMKLMATEAEAKSMKMKLMATEAGNGNLQKRLVVQLYTASYRDNVQVL